MHKSDKLTTNLVVIENNIWARYEDGKQTYVVEYAEYADEPRSIQQLVEEFRTENYE